MHDSSSLRLQRQAANRGTVGVLERDGQTLRCGVDLDESVGVRVGLEAVGGRQASDQTDETVRPVFRAEQADELLEERVLGDGPVDQLLGEGCRVAA